MTTYHFLKVICVLFCVSFHPSTSISIRNNIIITASIILLCSMPRSHDFVLKDYKDSWNSGPPWSQCKYCDHDVPSDANTMNHDEQPDLNSLRSMPNPDSLSPQASEFYPSAYQHQNSSGSHRLYRSLPSRRYRGPIFARPPIRLTSYRGSPPFRSTTHHFAPANITEPTIFAPDFISNPITSYLDNDGRDSQTGAIFQAWYSLPRKRGAKQKGRIQDIYHQAEQVYTPSQDINSQVPQHVWQFQPNSPGTSVLRATSTEFVSRTQRNIQPMDQIL